MRGQATLRLALQGVRLLPVDGGVDVHGGDAGGQAQGALGAAQEGQLQHGVQEGHPVVPPQELGCGAFKAGLVDALELGAVFVAAQPQLLVHVRHDQARRSLWVSWCLRGRAALAAEELGVGVLPLVHLPAHYQAAFVGDLEGVGGFQEPHLQGHGLCLGQDGGLVQRHVLEHHGQLLHVLAQGARQRPPDQAQVAGGREEDAAIDAVVLVILLVLELSDYLKVFILIIYSLCVLYLIF